MTPSTLRREMSKRRMSQVDLARLMGVDQSAVSLWLSGQRPITPQRAAHLREMFGKHDGQEAK